MKQWCLQASSFIFDRICAKLAGELGQDRHNIADGFELRLNQIIQFGVTCPWGQIKFSIDLLRNREDELAILISFYLYHQWGRGKAAFRFWSRFYHNCGFHGNRKLPLKYNGENDVCTLTPSVLIRSSSNLQITRTGIKSCTRSNFGQIEPLPSELGALERLKNSLWLIMGKWCLQANTFIFDWIFVKLAGNQNRHKISDEFKLWPDRSYVPMSAKNIPYILTLSNILRLGVKSQISSNSSQIGSFTSVLRALEKTFQRLYWENDVSMLARSLLIRSLLNLQVARTGKRSQTSLNSALIRPVTLELFALDCWNRP